MKNKLFIATFSEDALNVAKDFGVGLEINHTCISEDLDPSNRRNLLAQIRSDIAAAEVPDTSGLFLHGPFTEIHPAAIDYRARQLGMERLNEAYEAAAALGCQSDGGSHRLASVYLLQRVAGRKGCRILAKLYAR